MGYRDAYRDNKRVINEKLYETLLVYLTFIPFTVLGTYTRLGIFRLSSYEPSYITATSTIWSNMVACFLFGAIRYADGIITIDSYTLPSLTTGFCGTASSFSSFILELFQHSTHSAISGAQYPNAGYGVMEFLSVLLIQLVASGGALVFGQTVARHLLNHYTSYHKKLQKFINYGGKLMRFACIPIVVSQIVLAIVFSGNSRFWTLDALFGIVGASIRFELSKHFNNRFNWFPMGTFLANIISSTLACVLFILRYGLKDGHPLVTNAEATSMVLYLLLGFCGSLSTLSTFVYEGNNMPITNACWYYFLSVGICFCVSIVITGTYAWTHRIQDIQGRIA